MFQNKLRKDPMVTPAFEFKLKQFVDLTEVGAYQQSIDWVNENLKGGYEVVEKETITF